MRPFRMFRFAGRPAAERAGFEPAVARHHTAFREQHLKPLGHLSARDCTKHAAVLPGVRHILWRIGALVDRPVENKKPPHRGRLRYAWQDSNLRPLGPQPNALSPELQAHDLTVTGKHRGVCRALPLADHRSGEGGIRTLEGILLPYTLSRRAPSTTRPPPQWNGRILADDARFVDRWQIGVEFCTPVMFRVKSRVERCQSGRMERS